MLGQDLAEDVFTTGYLEQLTRRGEDIVQREFWLTGLPGRCRGRGGSSRLLGSIRRGGSGLDSLLGLRGLLRRSLRRGLLRSPLLGSGGGDGGGTTGQDCHGVQQILRRGSGDVHRDRAVARNQFDIDLGVERMISHLCDAPSVIGY